MTLGVRRSVLASAVHKSTRSTAVPSKQTPLSDIRDFLSVCLSLLSTLCGTVSHRKKVIDPVRRSTLGLLTVDRAQETVGLLTWTDDGRFLTLRDSPKENNLVLRHYGRRTLGIYIYSGQPLLEWLVMVG